MSITDRYTAGIESEIRELREQVETLTKQHAEATRWFHAIIDAVEGDGSLALLRATCLDSAKAGLWALEGVG